MSALQTFMLVVDHDKEEAKRIANNVAQGMWLCPRTAYTPMTNEGFQIQILKAKRPL